MLNRDTLPSVKRLKDFFFGAMNESGYASATPKSEPHPHITGWHICLHEHTHKETLPDRTSLLFSDEWGSRGGHSKIELVYPNLDRTLLWCMYYEGSYTPKVLPELKVALGETYRAKKFCGGRGLSRTFPDKELSYTNDVRGDFTEFSGTEHILGITEPDGGESTLGTHTYRGGVMISNLRET